jgi:hypothetical protein
VDSAVAIKAQAQDMVQAEVAQGDTLIIYQVKAGRGVIGLREMEALQTARLIVATAQVAVVPVAVAAAVVQHTVQIIAAVDLAAAAEVLVYTGKAPVAYPEILQMVHLHLQEPAVLRPA